MVACHPLGPIRDIKNPPAIIVKIVYFDVKDRIWARKHFLRHYLNQINRKPVYLFERLTKRDSDLLHYMKGLNLKTTTNNCAPQVFIKRKNGKVFTNNVADSVDAETLLASGKAQILAKKRKSIFQLGYQDATMRLNDNTTTPKRVSPPSPGSDQQILDYVKKHRNKPEKIAQYVDNLAKQSPQTELHSNVSITSSVFNVEDIG